jgi:hypothetical protein
MQQAHVQTEHINADMPRELVTGKMQDISECLDFGFYDEFGFWRMQQGLANVSWGAG